MCQDTSWPELPSPEGSHFGISGHPRSCHVSMHPSRVVSAGGRPGPGDAAEGLLAWRHSGFSVHHTIRADPWDTEGLERLCRYLVHPPIAVERLRYDGTQATYRGRRVHPVSGEDAVSGRG